VQVARVAPTARFAAARFPIQVLRRGAAELPLDGLRGRRVHLCTGVGDPASVRRSVHDLGATIIGEQIHPDHHRFTPADLAAAIAAAAAAGAELVVTAKDAIKLDALASDSARYIVLEQGVTVDGGEALVDEILRGSQRASGH
jgi:tetraacyldisaccharide-1-P 4'-kinase